jgi:UDP-N-acetylmuramyl pentapeptide phosphotransferase/UDP-N-acetylglucosamine-1-phosphate transferase
MLSFALGFLVSLLVLRYTHLYEKFSTGVDLAGAQKFQSRPVPRVGGTGILLRLIVSALQLHHAYPAVSGSQTGGNGPGITPRPETTTAARHRSQDT